MNRREIENQIAFKIWTAVPRIERYKIGSAVQILETDLFSFIYERSVKYATIHSREVSHPACDWSLAYSFIYP